MNSITSGAGLFEQPMEQTSINVLHWLREEVPKGWKIYCCQGENPETCDTYFLFDEFGPKPCFVHAVAMSLHLALFLYTGVAALRGQLVPDRRLHSEGSSRNRFFNVGSGVRQASASPWFHVVRTVCALLGACCGLMCIWHALVWQYNETVHVTYVVFWALQGAAWLVALPIMARERFVSEETHPMLLRIWWLISFSVLLIQSASAMLEFYRAVNIQEDVYFDDVVGFILFLPAILPAFAAVTGKTGVIVPQFSFFYEPLLSPTSQELGIQEDGADTASGVTKFARASLLSKGVFWWMNSLLIKGHQAPLGLSDIPVLHGPCRTRVCLDKFSACWDREVPPDAPFWKRPTLVGSLIWAFKKQILISGALALVQTMVMYAGPLLLQYFVEFVTDMTIPSHYGYTLVAILLLGKMVEVIANHQYVFMCGTLGIMIKSALYGYIFRKSLRLSNNARREHGVGEIVNYMTVDTQRMGELSIQIHFLWVLPLQIGIALTILFRVVGLATLGGVSTMLFFIVQNYGMSSWMRRHQEKVMTHKDERIKLMTESLQAMKILKLHGWEMRFMDKVAAIRAQEMRWVTKYTYLSAINIFFLWATPVVVTFATFAVAVLLHTPLTAAKAFTAICTFRILQLPIRQFPAVIAALVQAQVSRRRIQKFLDAEDMDMTAVIRSSVPRPTGSTKGSMAWELVDNGPADLASSAHEVSSGRNIRAAVEVINASFQWDLPAGQKRAKADAGANPAPEGTARESKSKEVEAARVAATPSPADKAPKGTPGGGYTLTDINLAIPKGALVAVVGRVGHGKSTLLQCMCGEVPKVGGEVRVSGRTAYVPQVAWIQSISVRDNILFGKPFDSVLYRDVLQRCCLIKDLEMLPAGDLTEIGERGINLSGGQKQRVQLARALYQQADVYLLDDPLSAVDAHTSGDLFEECIREGMRDKTVVLVTHNVELLPRTDWIVVMEGGRAVQQGTYDELVTSGLLFTEMLEAHAKGINRCASEVSLGMALAAARAETEKAAGWPEGAAKAARESLQAQPGGPALTHSRSIASAAVPEKATVAPERPPSAPVSALAPLSHSAHSAHPARHGNGVAEHVAAGGSEGGAHNRVGAGDGIGGAVEDPTGAGVASKRSRGGVAVPSGVGAPPRGVGKPGQLVKEEEKEVGDVSFDVYKAYTCHVMRGALIPILILSQALWQLFQICSDWWLAYATKESPSKPTLLHPWFSQGPQKLLASSIYESRPMLFVEVYAALSLTGSLFVYVRSVIIAFAGLRTAQHLCLTMLRSVFRSPMSFFDSTPSGRILNRASLDQAVVDSDIYFRFGSTLALFFQLLGIVLVSSVVTPWLIAAIVPLAFVYYKIQRYFLSSSRELTRLESITKAPVVNLLSESITGSAIIRAYGQEDRFMVANLKRVDCNQSINFHMVSASEWLGLHLEVIGSFILCMGALLVVLDREYMDPGFVGLTLSYGLSLNQCVVILVMILCQLENRMVAVERIMQFMKLKEEAALALPGVPPPGAWPSQGHVEITDLCVRYIPGGPLVLNHVSAEFFPREKVGIVGRTGSGKSTLLLSLFRVMEASGGSIRIDGIDIATVGLHDLRQRLGIIPQEPTLFAGTIRFNLDPHGLHSDDEIWQALERAQLATAVRNSPHRLDAPVFANGSNWSVGQRQLLCVGRALLHRCPILVMDEATASVDAGTDAMIQEIIATECRDCTVITIAHRISTVIDSDRVLVLDAGRVAEWDTPSKLLEAKGSLFGKLVAEYTARGSNFSRTTSRCDLRKV
eukprot:jgi/Mesvir1/10647/Mv13741-RA.2